MRRSQIAEDSRRWNSGDHSKISEDFPNRNESFGDKREISLRLQMHSDSCDYRHGYHISRCKSKLFSQRCTRGTYE